MLVIIKTKEMAEQILKLAHNIINRFSLVRTSNRKSFGLYSNLQTLGLQFGKIVVKLDLTNVDERDKAPKMCGFCS